MNNPREEAERIVEEISLKLFKFSMEMTVGEFEEEVKKLALFHVNGIIESKPQKPYGFSNTLSYWQEVKEIIEDEY